MKTTSSIEPLEARIAPAGVVAVAYNPGTGELTLTGDGLANTLNIIKTGFETHRIEVTGDTTLTGGALTQDIGNVTKLTNPWGRGRRRLLARKSHRSHAALPSVSVGKRGGVSTLLTGGAGIDKIDLQDNVTLAGSIVLNGNGGDDVVGFERNDLFGNSIIARLATIQTGAGNDTVLIGSATTASATGFPDSSRVNFLGGLTVDGCADTDTRNDYAAENAITGAPDISNFENVVP